MSDHDHEGTLTPAQDRAIATSALAKGDLSHAALHVACAIGDEPLDTEGLALLERLAATGRRPDEIYPLDGQISFGRAAARAWLEHRAGLHDYAFNLLCQVIGVRPDRPFTTWLAEWASDDAVVAALEPDDLPGTLSRAIEGAREVNDDAVARRACSELADIAAKIRRHHIAVPNLAGLQCRALRRAGRTAEAVAVCEAEDRRAPTYMSAVFLGGSLRDHGDLDGARRAYRTARSRPGSDASILLDVGDVSLDLRDYASAIAAYEEALAHGVGEHWARSSIAYCHWIQDGDNSHRDTLEQRADNGEARARQLLQSMSPYRRWLPDPIEAIISSARQVESGEVTSAPLSIAISSVEAPSAVAETLAYCRARFGSEPTVSMSVPDPDPRRPRRSGAAWLWKYHQDFRPIPAVPPPAAHIAQRVADVAARTFERAAWFDAAGDMVEGLDAAAERDLYGVMVHAPPAPHGTKPWDWRRRVQVVAAMGLAWLPGGAAAAIERLRFLVDGQVDWTCTAALVVLTEIADRAPEQRDAIAQLFEDVYETPLCPVVFMCLLRPVADLALQLPDRSPEFCARWRARRAELAD
jgi:tetratricopeptide (TPR) repeat protein